EPRCGGAGDGKTRSLTRRTTRGGAAMSGPTGAMPRRRPANEPHAAAFFAKLPQSLRIAPLRQTQCPYGLTRDILDRSILRFGPEPPDKQRRGGKAQSTGDERPRIIPFQNQGRDEQRSRDGGDASHGRSSSQSRGARARRKQLRRVGIN